MRAVELDKDDVEEIMSALPKELRKKLLYMMTQGFSNQSIERLKRFVAEYDDQCQIDGIIANTCANIIDKIGRGLTDASEGKKNFNGLDAGLVVMKILRKEADNIDDVVKKGREREHADCGHEHD